MTKTLHARLVAYAPGGDRLGVLQQPLGFDASIIHNDLGALKVTYSRRAVGGGLLKRGLETGLEISLEVSDGGAWTEPYNCRFLLVARSRNAEDVSDTLTLTCQAYGWLSNKILNNDTAHLIQDGDNKGKRAFLSKNPGTILRTILDENRTRGGAATMLAAGFDTGRDSAGAAWKSVYTLYYSLGTSLQSMISSMVGGGAVDWRTSRRTLNVWNSDSASLSRDLSATVHVSLARDVLEAPEDESIEDLSSDILVEGDNGLVFRESNPAAPTPWGKWESYVSQGGIADQSTARAFMQTTLASSARVRGQYTRSLLVTNAQSLPLVDYRPGDWISAPTVAHGEKVRIQQVTVSLDSSGLKASVTLNDKVYDAQIRQAKKIQGITGGASMAGSEGGRPAPEHDHRVAKAPEGLVAATSAYIASDGTAQGLAILSWAQVTQATDNTALDIQGYRAEYRKNATGAPWQYGGDADGTTIAIGRLECGVEYAFRVRATPTYSDKPGQWSAQTVIRVASDTTPPSVPSTPVLTSKLGVVDVFWDGKNNAGGGMELDFDHCEVGISDANGNWSYKDRILKDNHCIVTGLEYREYWFALRAVDMSGNKSDWSKGAKVTVASAVSNAEVEQIGKDVAANKQAIAEANKDLAANKQAISEANKRLDSTATELNQAKTDLNQAKQDITAATSTAEKALDAANKVGTAIDGLHSVYTGPDDPTTLAGVTVREGDLWNQTQKYWTRWEGDANNSASLLADFYTYWEGEPNNSASVLVTLDSRIIATKRWDGTQWVSMQYAELETAKAEIEANKTQLDAADKLIAGNTAAIETERQRITDTSTLAQKALDRANSVGTTLDGMHNTFKGPDDPTTLAGVTVRQGDYWYKTQTYWTRWEGEANNSASLLADFYTYWEGEPNNSASVLVTLDSRITGVYVYDGAQWNEFNLVAANILATGSVVASNMAVGSITTTALAANSVTAGKITAGAILARHLSASSVTAEALAALSVTADKLAAKSVTAEKIVSNAITTDKLAALTVTADKLAANSVTADKIAANSVNASKIVAGAITADKLAANSVNADKLTANSVTGDKLAANSVTAVKIAARTITADRIAAGAITSYEIAANTIKASNIAAGAITTDELAANAVTAGKIAARTITADKIAAGTITANELAAGSVTAGKLTSGSVTADKIAAGAITASKLAADAITSKTITGCTITGGTFTTTGSNHSLNISSGRIRGYNGSTQYGLIDFAVNNGGGNWPGIMITGNSTIALNAATAIYSYSSKNGWKIGSNDSIKFTPAAIKSDSKGNISWMVGHQTLSYNHGFMYAASTTNASI